MNPDTEIAFVAPALTAGGAERVISVMANYWAARKCKLTLITVYAATLDFYALHPSIRRVELNITAPSRNFIDALRNNLSRLKALRRSIREIRPDVIISFVDATNILTLCATIGLGIPIIVSERTDPSQHVVGRFWQAMRRITYPRAAAVIVQSQNVLTWLHQTIPSANGFIISNPVRERSPNMENIAVPRGNLIIAIGRLTSAKGFDLLITAFARCAAEHSTWSLVIIGDGELREQLRNLAVSFGLSDRVHFVGQIKEPMQVLDHAKLFVLSSRYEGFPNALLEAMTCGLPVIAFDCPSGPREIIRDKVDGVLVAPGDVTALANSMDLLMRDPNCRAALARRASDVRKRFSLTETMKQWERIIEDVRSFNH